jgi:ferrous iron transport protein A
LYRAGSRDEDHGVLKKDRFLMNLTGVKEGQKVKVTDIEGGEGLSRRLENLGIRKGAVVIKVTAQSYKGPVIVKIGHTQVALGQGMAQKVLVDFIDASV